MIRILTAGESHGQALIGIVEGIPAGLEISADYINFHLKRRQQGYGRGGRMRIEEDRVEILSGVRFGKTIGSPIALMIRNKDWENWKEKMSVEEIDKQIEKITIPRPGHADFVGYFKYGFDDIRNVIERASARETAIRVACSSIARKLLEELGIFIGSHVIQIGYAGFEDREKLDKKIQKLIHKPKGALELTLEADKSEVRCIDKQVEGKMIEVIKEAKKKGDTVGGIFEVIVTGLPVGLGSYVHWDRKLDGLLAQAIMSIQAIKGVEIGSAFENAKKFGSEVHDEIFVKNGKIFRRTNRAGGLEGGVTNGQPIVLRIAMKPISTVIKGLSSVDLKTFKNVKSRYERSDFCAVPSASVIAESVIAPVIANALLEKFGGDSLKELKKNYKNAIFVEW
ncbi:chorismate synthase [Candidatus Chrysopegis kryptomonas]|uniref:Chorismate synthase n=1 Tax=Candidatus Chryseopegocella kryptomonas TaxID=1633643 RepID=A0A0P1MV20_9BACT|nr:chorismate synthase [Candidatus Chrysopegis kryptomonas]CUS99361.1 chorismate synthase [Candidatus Chrysopegis kryptomonas]